AEHAGNLREPARADAVRALFVFLDLLESDANTLAELGLREALLQTADSNVLSDQHVNRLWRPFCHDHGSENSESYDGGPDFLAIYRKWNRITNYKHAS